VPGGPWSGDVALVRSAAAESGRFAVIDRLQGDIALFEFADGAVTTTATLGVDPADNPQDAAVAADGAVFVALYGSPNLLVIGAGEQGMEEVDLSGLTDDADGVPDMAFVFAHEGAGRVYVVLQSLAEFVPAGPGVVAVLDVATHAVLTDETVRLPGDNPFFAVEVDGVAQLALVGAFGAPDGRAVTLDLATAAVETRFTEASVEGDILGFVPVVGGWLATIATADFTTRLVFVSEQGSVEPLIVSAGYDLGPPSIDPLGATVLVPDAAEGMGVHVLDASDPTRVVGAAYGVGGAPARVVLAL